MKLVNTGFRQTRLYSHCDYSHIDSRLHIHKPTVGAISRPRLLIAYRFASLDDARQLLGWVELGFTLPLRMRNIFEILNPSRRRLGLAIIRPTQPTLMNIQLSILSNQ